MIQCMFIVQVQVSGLSASGFVLVANQQVFAEVPISQLGHIVCVRACNPGRHHHYVCQGHVKTWT